MPGYWKAYKLLRKDNSGLLRTAARIGGSGVSPVAIRLIVVDTGATYTVLPVQVVGRSSDREMGETWVADIP